MVLCISTSCTNIQLCPVNHTESSTLTDDISFIPPIIFHFKVKRANNFAWCKMQCQINCRNTCHIFSPLSFECSRSLAHEQGPSSCHFPITMIKHGDQWAFEKINIQATCDEKSPGLNKTAGLEIGLEWVFVCQHACGCGHSTFKFANL